MVLDAAVATNQAQCVASWRDITAAPTYVAGRSVANTNSTTDVDLVASPAASTQRVIDYLSVYNNDTTSIAINVRLDASGTDYILWRGTIATNERVEYENGKGWTVTSASGVVKYVGDTGSTGSAGVGVPAGGTTGQLLRKSSATNFDTAWWTLAVGSTSGLPIQTGASGVLEVGAFGSSAGQFAEGNHLHNQFNFLLFNLVQ